MVDFLLDALFQRLVGVLYLEMFHYFLQLLDSLDSLDFLDDLELLTINS